MGPVSGRVLLVGCEPATLGGEEGQMGLSEAVSAVVDEAAKLVSKLVREARNAAREIVVRILKKDE